MLAPLIVFGLTPICAVIAVTTSAPPLLDTACMFTGWALASYVFYRSTDLSTRRARRGLLRWMAKRRSDAVITASLGGLTCATELNAPGVRRYTHRVDRAPAHARCR